MEHLLISCIKSRIENNRSLYGSFQIGPFDKGQALTVANAMRRTLLSELSGLAIVCVEIQGVSHEYSNIKGVRESVLDILLNLKQISFISDRFYTSPEIGFLKIQGPAIIKSCDLKLSPYLKCVDPDQYIATLADNSTLEIKFMICKGKNFTIQTSFDLIKKKFKSCFSNTLKNEIIISTLNTKNFLQTTRKIPTYKYLNFKKLPKSLKNYNFFKSKINTRNNELEKKFTYNQSQTHEAGKLQDSEKLIFDTILNSKNKKLNVKFFQTIENTLLSSNFNISKFQKDLNIDYKQNLKQNSNTNILLLDPVFMPVIKVNYSIQNVDNFYKIKNKTLKNKFFKKTSQEKIILEIWTNGSISPKNSIYKAVQQLINIFIPLQKTYLLESNKDSIKNINIQQQNFALLRKKKLEINKFEKKYKL